MPHRSPSRVTASSGTGWRSRCGSTNSGWQRCRRWPATGVGETVSVTLAVALYAAVIATAGLLWQIVSWIQGRRTVLKVTGFHAMVVGIQRPGRMLLLNVRSSAHTPPVYIDQWGFMIKGKKHLVGPAWSQGPDTPHRLEPGQRVSWILDDDEGRKSLAANHPTPNHFWDVRPWVRLQTGSAQAT